jgi:hypothetical protein
MTIAIKNCKALVKRGNDGSEVLPEAIGNMQMLTQKTLNDFFGDFEADRRPTHRIRLDPARNPNDKSQFLPNIPTEGDMVFVTKFKAAPWCLGQWEIVDVSYDTGELASFVLYVKRPVLNQTGISMAG